MIIDAERIGSGHAPAGVRVDFQDRRGEAAPLPVDADRLGRLLAATLDRVGVPGPARVEVTWVDPDEIAQLNADHLDGDGPTDVLSFPLDPFPDEADTQGDPIDPLWGRMVGDVVIAPDVAAAQAAGHAGTPADELALLVVHAGLHLAGHDHAEPDERAAMVALERELLADHWGPLAADPWAPDHPAVGHG